MQQFISLEYLISIRIYYILYATINIIGRMSMLFRTDDLINNTFWGIPLESLIDQMSHENDNDITYSSQNVDEKK